MDTLQSLQQLGPTDKEAQVYLALLELGQASVYVVALKANMKRPTAYVIIDELIKKL